VSEIAFKFTETGARSPFTGFSWEPGEWAEAEGPLELCRNGVHACRAHALPRWLNDELWLIELEEVMHERDSVLVARRGRLLERIDEWSNETARELARSCAARVRQLADDRREPLVRSRADDIERTAERPDPTSASLAMYCTAHTLDELLPGGYEDERQRQAEWLRVRLELDTTRLGA
jgi:hypothetical protein